MKLLSGVGAALFLAIGLTGCGGKNHEVMPLPPAEIFTWTGGQPISFSPPPEDWKRSRYQNGGTEGAQFVLAGSGGEMVFLAERFFLGSRDRCDQINKLLQDLDDSNPRTFRSDLTKARRYRDKSFNYHERETVGVVNRTLERAGQAYRAGDMYAVQNELSYALEQTGTIRYTVKETVEQALFTAERNPVYPALQVDAPMDGEWAGGPAIIVKFAFTSSRVPMIGRRIYVVRNNRMFEIGFQGREENLPLFERIVDSITFPAGPCEH